MKKMIVLYILLFSANISLAKPDLAAISDVFINKNSGNLKTPGAIIAVVDDRKIAHFRTFGQRDLENNLPVEKSTLFRIGSLTKTFTATAIMILRDKGELKLDDPVERYIEELKDIDYPYPNSPRITIRHLVTHSSGLIRHPEPEDQSIQGLIREVVSPTSGSTFIKNSENIYWYPGFKYEYSNVAIALLGEVVSRIVKTPIDAFIQREILSPLDMHQTYWHESQLPQELRSYSYDMVKESWEKHSDWNLKGYAAAGSIYSNIEDLTKWMHLQFQTSPLSSSAILSPFTLEEMHNVQILDSTESNHRGTGVVWYTNTVNGYSQTGHNGATGGYMAYFGFDKTHKVGVIVLASNGQVDTTTYGQGLLAHIQTEIKKDVAKHFYPIAEKLIPYLQLKTQSEYHRIFDQSLFDYFGTDEQWVNVLLSLQSKYGMVEEIITIEGFNSYKANLKLKTSTGILSYTIFLSSSEKGKLSGIKVAGYQGK